MRIRVSTDTAAQRGQAYSSSGFRRGKTLVFFDIGGIRHACVSLPSRFLNLSFDIHVFISHRVRGILNPWDVTMNDIEMLEVIVLVLKIVLICNVEGFCFVIVR